MLRLLGSLAVGAGAARAERQRSEAARYAAALDPDECWPAHGAGPNGEPCPPRAPGGAAAAGRRVAGTPPGDPGAAVAARHRHRGVRRAGGLPPGARPGRGERGGRGGAAGSQPALQSAGARHARQLRPHLGLGDPGPPVGWADRDALPLLCDGGRHHGLPGLGALPARHRLRGGAPRAGGGTRSTLRLQPPRRLGEPVEVGADPRDVRAGRGGGGRGQLAAQRGGARARSWCCGPRARVSTAWTRKGASCS